MVEPRGLAGSGDSRAIARTIAAPTHSAAALDVPICEMGVAQLHPHVAVSEQPRERSAGRERAGQDSDRADREHDRGPGGAGGFGRESEHEKAAEPKPKTPDVDLGRRRPAARMRAGLRDGGRLHDIADEMSVVAPARIEALVAGGDLAAATVRSRVARLPALTARARAERSRPGRSPRDEPCARAP